MKKQKTKFLTKTIITNSEISEIDFILDADFKIKESNFNMIEIGNGDVDAYPIKIDTIIQELNRFKELGANYVEIDYHPDHIGYEFTASTIVLSSDDEIAAEVNKANAHNDKIRRINELQLEINSIRDTMTLHC